MQIKSLSKYDATRVLELIHRSVSCTTEAQLVDIMAELRGLIGYQAGLSAVAGRKNGAPPELHVVNVDYPHDYLAELFRRDLVRKDPIVAENFRTFRLQYWGDTFTRTPFTADTHEVISLAEDFGFNETSQGHGYGHGVKTGNGNIGSFFCYHGLERSARTETILTLLVPHFHEALSRIVGPKLGSIPALTPREKELLAWLAQGKNTWEISAILRISERTVKFHVGNILQKLNASTRGHAVAIALGHGLMEME
ncbi:helix-turn-helix transcriptional regulator [Thiohalomonas denitrificans]|uniref:helix-turn-helix transcriptional regulator n=1 Tax=Thiohalomonas denitrificans TaxID=415747 RepID=UPI0026EF8551|nr:LuxR family transcriptional regulator [Thiohalomonas denitrificans]